MLSLVGVDPSLRIRYQWIGDSACDRERSDLTSWLARGEGLAAREGQKVTTLVCEPLRPTALEIVFRHGLVGAEVLAQPQPAGDLMVRNMPAVLRAAVGYAVVGIEDGPPCERTHDAGGLRLSDALLDMLDRQVVMLEHDGRTRRLRLVEHLGNLVIAASLATEEEGKA